MEKRRWVIDAILVTIVVVLGLLVVYRFKDILASWRGDAEQSQVTETENVSEASVNPTETESSAQATLEPTETPSSSEDQTADPPRAPEFTLLNLEGESVSLSDYLGTPVLVNFWATWCPPCRAEMPLIQQFQDDFASEFIVLAVNGGETEAQVRGFMETNGLSLTFLLDSENSVAQQYGIRGFPTSLFIDSEGYLQAYHIGEVNEDLLTRYLAQIGVSK